MPPWHPFGNADATLSALNVNDYDHLTYRTLKTHFAKFVRLWLRKSAKLTKSGIKSSATRRSEAPLLQGTSFSQFFLSSVLPNSRVMEVKNIKDVTYVVPDQQDLLKEKLKFAWRRLIFYVFFTFYAFYIVNFPEEVTSLSLLIWTMHILWFELDVSNRRNTVSSISTSISSDDNTKTPFEKIQHRVLLFIREK
jgi:hypothetical protein